MTSIRYEQAVIHACLEGLRSLGVEMHQRLVVETPIETGDMRQDAYASLNDQTGTIELGYDETGRNKPHAYYVIFGTSKMAANPALQRTCYRRYRARRGDGS